MVDHSDYRVGEVLKVEEAAKKGGKSLKICTIRVSENADETPLTVVTNAPNVREQSRVVVAPVGSTVLSDEGEEIKVEKRSVGGVVSEGMLCDSRMLGWTGGANGIAVQVPAELGLGKAPPSEKPRPKTTEQESTGPVTDGLFAPKLSKEEKKKLAAEKRAAKKAAKDASKS